MSVLNRASLKADDAILSEKMGEQVESLNDDQGSDCGGTGGATDGGESDQSDVALQVLNRRQPRSTQKTIGRTSTKKRKKRTDSVSVSMSAKKSAKKAKKKKKKRVGSVSVSMSQPTHRVQPTYRSPTRSLSQSRLANFLSPITPGIGRLGFSDTPGRSLRRFTRTPRRIGESDEEEYDIDEYD
eukprot:928295_1